MPPELTAKLFVLVFAPLGWIALAGWAIRLWLAYRKRQRQ